MFQLSLAGHYMKIYEKTEEISITTGIIQPLCA